MRPESRRRLKQLGQGFAWALSGTVYLYIFFYYQPDRSRERLDNWMSEMQNAEDVHVAIRPYEVAPNGESTTATESIVEEASTQKAPKSFLHQFLDWFFFWMAFSIFFRLYLQHCIRPRLLRARAQRWQSDARQRRQRFLQWVSRLNRQRASNGQQPLSTESLSLVLRERELDGEDYDGLLQFDQEAGPAMEALLNSVGATPQEIDRCPLRVLQADDDLLIHRDDGRNQCPICLEAFVVNDTVRTIPCFHSFHQECIDPWLAQRAQCPVCKYNAIG